MTASQRWPGVFLQNSPSDTRTRSAPGRPPRSSGRPLCLVDLKPQLTFALESAPLLVNSAFEPPPCTGSQEDERVRVGCGLHQGGGGRHGQDGGVPAGVLAHRPTASLLDRLWRRSLSKRPPVALNLSFAGSSPPFGSSPPSPWLLTSFHPGSSPWHLTSLSLPLLLATHWLLGLGLRVGDFGFGPRVQGALLGSEMGDAQHIPVLCFSST